MTTQPPLFGMNTKLVLTPCTLANEQERFDFVQNQTKWDDDKTLVTAHYLSHLWSFQENGEQPPFLLGKIRHLRDSYVILSSSGNPQNGDALVSRAREITISKTGNFVFAGDIQEQATWEKLFKLCLHGAAQGTLNERNQQKKQQPNRQATSPKQPKIIAFRRNHNGLERK